MYKRQWYELVRCESCNRRLAYACRDTTSASWIYYCSVCGDIWRYWPNQNHLIRATGQEDVEEIARLQAMINSGRGG